MSMALVESIKMRQLSVSSYVLKCNVIVGTQNVTIAFSVRYI